MSKPTRRNPLTRTYPIRNSENPEYDTSQGEPVSVRKRNESSIPLRRYGDPEEFGRLAAFLLSPAASYISGSVMAVDGGLLRTL